MKFRKLLQILFVCMCVFALQNLAMDLPGPSLLYWLSMELGHRYFGIPSLWLIGMIALTLVDMSGVCKQRSELFKQRLARIWDVMALTTVFGACALVACLDQFYIGPPEPQQVIRTWPELISTCSFLVFLPLALLMLWRIANRKNISNWTIGLCVACTLAVYGFLLMYPDNRFNSESIFVGKYTGYTDPYSGVMASTLNHPPYVTFQVSKVLKGPLHPDNKVRVRYYLNDPTEWCQPKDQPISASMMPADGSVWIVFIPKMIAKDGAYDSFHGSKGIMFFDSHAKLQTIRERLGARPSTEF